MPPESNVQPIMRELAAMVAKKSGRQIEPEFVVDILRLTQPYGEVLGSAQCIQTLPVGCFLAAQAADRADCPDTKEYIRAIGRSLNDDGLIDSYPDIRRRPSQGRNTLLHVHLTLGGSQVYARVALDLQRGILKALEKTAWNQSPRASKTLSALISGLLRVVPLLPEREFSESWDSGDPMRCAGIIGETIRSLPRLRGGAREQPLSVGTERAYLRDIALLLNRPEWLEYESTLGGMGGSILGEPEEEIEADHARAFFDTAERTVRELDPGASLEPTYWEPSTREFALSSDRAVLEEYPTLIRYSATPPNVAADILREILSLKENRDQRRLKNRTYILSLLLLGRSEEFLRRITVGSWPSEGEAVKNPRYIPEKDCVVYDPADCVRGLPTAPRDRKPSYTPVSPFWVLPLPAPLRPFWQDLAAGRGGEWLFEGVDEGDAPFRAVTEWVRRKYPGAPAVTPARLRSAFTTLMLCKGRMDPLLAAFVSGQWRISHRAPLFYTTISSGLLCERFEEAVRRVWDFLRTIQPAIPDYDETGGGFPKRIWMGSPFRPQSRAIRRMVSALQIQIRESTDEEETHNRKTVLLLFLLAVVGGLRFGEVSTLKAIHFDLALTCEGKPLPWLVIDHAKGNWFSTAARIVPLPPKLAGLAGSVVSADQNQPAFYFRENGRRLPATATMLHNRLEAIRSAIHWHSGRHFLRSWLCAQGADFDLTNALIGHQGQGRELLNPHLPNRPWNAWREMGGWMEKLMDELGVEEGG
jgi:hypothetical protein